MVNYSQTGHARNVINFGKLIAEIKALRDKYNPTMKCLQVDALEAQLQKAYAGLDMVKNALPVYKNAISEREAAFSDFSKFITRINYALKTSNISSQTEEKAASLIRKLLGKRSTAKKTAEEKKLEAENGKSVTEYSTSQMSYDSRLENFDQFIKFLASIPTYNPNEEELKIASLQRFCETLREKNDLVLNAAIPLQHARIQRNEILYNKIDGLVGSTNGVKKYIKSVYGASSPQYKLFSSIKFTNLNKL